MDEDRLRAFLTDSAPATTDALAEWVSIPSVAADPDRTGDMLRSARWIAQEMRNAGLSSTVYQTGEAAAVYGEWIVDESLPTVLVYSHHDVRHAKAEEWSITSPFEPVVRDGRLYGRGASDAKGQVMAHLWGLRAHLAATGRDRPMVNLKFLVEGEEETGSPHLRQLLEDHRDEFACDVIVFSDTVQWTVDDPGVVTSMRGIVTASLSINGPTRDVHSGTASGVAPNPTHVLARVLSALHDAEGHIALPGFYDDVVPIDAERAAELRDVPFDDASWTARTETRSVTGENGSSPKERLWARPSLEVLTLLAGDPGGIPRAVIPAVAQATLNIRIVPDQRVDKVAQQLRDFVEQVMPETVSSSLQVDVEIGQNPYVTPPGAALEALARAVAAGFGRQKVHRVGNAGGGPADLLSTAFRAPVLFLGTGLPEDHWHSSDESISLRMLLQGAASVAHLWAELGGMRPGELR